MRRHLFKFSAPVSWGREGLKKIDIEKTGLATLLGPLPRWGEESRKLESMS
jgi:hypothetical protein